MINSLLFILLAIFWGGSFIAIKVLIQEVPSFSAAFLRVFFASIFLFIISLPKIIRIQERPDLKTVFISSVTGLFSIGIPFSLLFWGEMFIAPSLAGVLNGTVPFWTLVIAIIFFKDTEKITKRKLIGLALGLIGITFIFAPKLQFSGSLSELKGVVAIIAMAISYAIGINLNKRILSRYQIETNYNLIIQHVISSFYLFTIILFFEKFPPLEIIFSTKNLVSILYLALFSTTLAFIIFFKLIRELGPVKASMVTFFVPAVALILDSVINSERLSYTEAIGTTIIFMSMNFLRQVNEKQKN